MVQMGNHQGKPQISQRSENIQQGNGIGTSGNGDDHPITLREQPLIPNGFRYFFQHWIRSQ